MPSLKPSLREPPHTWMTTSAAFPIRDVMADQSAAQLPGLIGPPGEARPFMWSSASMLPQMASAGAVTVGRPLSMGRPLGVAGSGAARGRRDRVRDWSTRVAVEEEWKSRRPGWQLSACVYMCVIES